MNAANMARDHGLRSVEVRVSGPGSGRESAIRALAAAGIEVAPSRTSRPCRITDAIRRSGAECKKVSVAGLTSSITSYKTLWFSRVTGTRD